MPCSADTPENVDCNDTNQRNQRSTITSRVFVEVASDGLDIYLAAANMRLENQVNKEEIIEMDATFTFKKKQVSDSQQS